MPTLTQHGVRDFLGTRVTRVGFAPVDRFEGAPEEHHPAYVLDGAATVIVLAVAVPKGILHSKGRSLYSLHRAYHTVYPLLDEIGLSLANHIEEQTGHLATTVPSYAPLTYREGIEPWGVLSLKHAAVRAGLGAFGKNGLVHNPDFGTMLRLGAVVTTAPFEGSEMLGDDPCPPGCKLCHKACPSQAIGPEGEFAKLTCLGHTIKHAIYPLAIRSKEDMRHLERITNTAGYNYWLTCHVCLSSCPNNRPKRAA